MGPLLHGSYTALTETGWNRPGEHLKPGNGEGLVGHNWRELVVYVDFEVATKLSQVVNHFAESVEVHVAESVESSADGVMVAALRAQWACAATLPSGRSEVDITATHMKLRWKETKEALNGTGRTLEFHGRTTPGAPLSYGGSAKLARTINSSEDASSTTFKPLAKFASEFKPQKDAEQYLRDAMEVPKLSESTGRFVDQLVEMSWSIAQDRINNSNVLKRHAGLTQQHAFAIAAFTLELQTFCVAAEDNDEFYRQYNQALRSRSPGTIKLLTGYSHFLFAGLQVMPKFQGYLWRGIRGEDAVQLVLGNYTRRFQEVHWSAFSSATPSREVAKQFATASGLLFRIEVDGCAFDIRDLSALPEEDERLLVPNAKMVIDRHLYKNPQDGMREVHLAEVVGEFRF